MQNNHLHVKNIDLIQKTEVNCFTSLVHKVLLRVQQKSPVNGAGSQYSEKVRKETIKTYTCLMNWQAIFMHLSLENSSGLIISKASYILGQLPY